MVQHDPVAVEAASRFWATSLGVDVDRLEADEVTVVPNATKFPLRGVVILRRKGTCILSIVHSDPSSVIDAVMEIGRKHPADELIQQKAWQDVSEVFVSTATVFTNSRERVPPLPRRGVKDLVEPDDLMRVGRLMDRADPMEWEIAGVDPRGGTLAGVYVDEELVAVGSLERASEELGIVRIFVSPAHRRRGLASSIASHLANRSATTFRALQMTVIKGDARGEGLALGLGFFPFGETASVVLKN